MCPAHPERPAVAACSVCGERHCAACAPIHPRLHEPACATCAAVLDRAPVRSRRSRAPLALVAVALLAAAAVWQLRPRPAPLAEAYAALEQTAFALEVYRAREGSYPAVIEVLLEQDLDQLPRDPFDPSGGPLRYAAPASNPDGRVLYSLGPDRLDQRGTPRDPISLVGDLCVPVR